MQGASAACKVCDCFADGHVLPPVVQVVGHDTRGIQPTERGETKELITGEGEGEAISGPRPFNSVPLAPPVPHQHANDLCKHTRRTPILAGRVLSLRWRTTLFPRSSSGQDLGIRLSWCPGVQQRGRMEATIFTVGLVAMMWELPGRPYRLVFFLSVHTRKLFARPGQQSQPLSYLRIRLLLHEIRMVDLRSFDCSLVECPRIVRLELPRACPPSRHETYYILVECSRIPPISVRTFFFSLNYA